MKGMFLPFIAVILVFGRVFPDNLTLCYHQFDYSLNNVFSVIPDVFEWQMDYLRKKNIDIITVEKLVSNYTVEGRVGTNVLVTIDDGWTNNRSILGLIRRENIPVTLFYIANGSGVSNRYFSSNEIMELAEIPQISIGSHSMNHIPLVKKSEAVLKREIVKSKEKLESMLQRDVDSFAYPFGSYDSAAKKMAGKTYKLAFGIENGPNGIRRDRSNLRRDVIYRTTTFGEFISLVDDILGKRKNKGYRVVNLGNGKEKPGRYFRYVKVRLFEFGTPTNGEPERKPDTVLVVPGSTIGPAWIYRLIDRLSSSGIRTCVMVPRNNNVPYWRPDREMNLVTNWNIESFQADMRATLEYVSENGGHTAVVAWNEGYDILLSTLLRYPELATGIRGIFGVNPSIRGDPAVRDIFGFRVESIDRKMAGGDFTNESLRFFLKVKTIADLAILKPDQSSPYSLNMGYGFRSNFDLLRTVIRDQSDPDLSLDGLDEHYTMKEFHQTFFRPLPVFSMVVPMALERDINELWERNFDWKEKKITGRDSLKMPVYFVYSSGHRSTVTRLTNTFAGMPLAGSRYYGSLSTVEMLLSSPVADLAMERLTGWLK